MRTLYFDCTSGISGDMTVASLIDLGIDFADIERELQKLPLHGYQVKNYNVLKQGISAQRFSVTLTEDMHHHRTLRDINKIIDQAGFSISVQKIAKDIFYEIALAEGKIHNKPTMDVHFHEVGAVDSIVDIVATAICISQLQPDRIVFSKIREGQGMIRCAHGIIPVPAPATLEILSNAGAVIEFTENTSEMITPTGAGIVATIGHEYGKPAPCGRIIKIGYGAGEKDFDHPNVLRTLLIESAETNFDDTVYMLEAQVDDMTGEALGFAMEQLFNVGCVDVFFTPIYMKKSRPGTKITAVCKSSFKHAVLECMLKHTTTLGVRIQSVSRLIMKREVIPIETKYGIIDVKRAVYGDIVKIHAEYEQVRQAALKHNVELACIMHEINLQLGELASCNFMGR